MELSATAGIATDQALAIAATTRPVTWVCTEELFKLGEHPQHAPHETMRPGSDVSNTGTASPPLRPLPNYRFTPRDISILHFIGQNGFATGRDICAKFFEYEGNNLHLRRLRKLRMMGFIAHLTGDRQVHLGYSLTRKGRARLEEEGVAVPPGRRRGVYKSSYSHDLQLQRIRRTLERSPLVSNFRTEIELRSDAAKAKGRSLTPDDLIKVPDGTFTLKCPSRVLKVALELELATKSESRYRKMLRALCTMSVANCTFILCGKETTMTRLRSLLEDVRARDPYVLGLESYRSMYFGLAPEFLSKGLDARFAGEGKTFSLRELAATDPKSDRRLASE